MVVFPNAKINLGLNILRRRDDGFHDISTVMYPVGWSDVLEIVPGTGANSTLTVTGRGVACPPEKNLVMRALNALREIATFPAVDIFLEKIIPDGAGLGGGSSDAAFTITTVNTLFSLGLTDEIMAETAAKVGSDCPFFIYNRPMLATGRGEILTPVEVELVDYSLVMVKPAGCSVSTKTAYSGVTPRVPTLSVAEIIDRPTETWRSELVNDFEETVAAIHPTIDRIKGRLYEMGAVYSAMSGSGSAVFGIYPANISLKDLEKTFAGMDIYIQPAAK
ncbi:MAG: 4-(cytidine 5'-diphospho)-2-C-methyl-D-erythritol kinase [Muribaculaceae bacterium]|nr:4-(cytidine 5'-diphospho)-2-C-methyl-D-erythritol kinase [Muribaculaceae bacterium]